MLLEKKKTLGEKIKVLWSKSPAKLCPYSCACILPKQCTKLTPEQVSYEIKKQKCHESKTYINTGMKLI